MKKIIRKILKEEINKKEYIKNFKVIDKLLSGIIGGEASGLNKETLLSADLYDSSDTFSFLYDYFTEKIGYSDEETNKIIGSYIETNQNTKPKSRSGEGEDSEYSEKNIKIAKPKTYNGEFSQYVSGYQKGQMDVNGVYSVPEATKNFRDGYYDNWEITNDNTESNDFDIEDVYEEN